jgi:nucleotide-binding universal stress UspA family protein
MLKPSRILLYYDGSNESRSALHRAADLARALDAHTDILTVANTELAIAASAGYLTEMAFVQIRDSTLNVLQDAIDRMEKHGISAHGHLAHGDIVSNISRYANLLSTDLLVIGHRTRSRLKRWLGWETVHAELLERCNGLAVVTIPCD